MGIWKVTFSCHSCPYCTHCTTKTCKKWAPADTFPMETLWWQTQFNCIAYSVVLPTTLAMSTSRLFSAQAQGRDPCIWPCTPLTNRLHQTKFECFSPLWQKWLAVHFGPLVQLFLQVLLDHFGLQAQRVANQVDAVFGAIYQRQIRCGSYQQRHVSTLQRPSGRCFPTTLQLPAQGTHENSLGSGGGLHHTRIVLPLLWAATKSQPKSRIKSKLTISKQFIWVSVTWCILQSDFDHVCFWNGSYLYVISVTKRNVLTL